MFTSHLTYGMIILINKKLEIWMDNIRGVGNGRLVGGLPWPMSKTGDIKNSWYPPPNIKASPLSAPTLHIPLRWLTHTVCGGAAKAAWLCPPVAILFLVSKLVTAVNDLQMGILTVFTLHLTFQACGKKNVCKCVCISTVPAKYVKNNKDRVKFRIHMSSLGTFRS